VGFTLIEVITVIAILGILIFVSVELVNPRARVEESQAKKAITELSEIAKAVQLFALDNGYYPDDVVRGLPPGIDNYITPEPLWPDGPFNGSVYDYDNWTGQNCIDPEASNSIQITLREVPGQNPDGSIVWAWYYPIFGKGSSHCNNVNEWDKGECVICEDFSIEPN
jgi:prepilin-type N-terminal cleavage/methylation domain-containing protein